MLHRMELAGGRVMPNDDMGNVFLYVDPDENERKYLAETLKLDEHTLASALDPDELARLEFEPDHVAIISKRPRNYSSDDTFVFRVASIGLFLFADRLVIVVSEEVPLFQGKQYAQGVVASRPRVEDHLQLDLPFRRASQGDQCRFRRPGGADQRLDAK